MGQETKEFLVGSKSHYLYECWEIEIWTQEQSVSVFDHNYSLAKVSENQVPVVWLTWDIFDPHDFLLSWRIV